MSRGQSQRRTDSRKRALERCKSKGKANYVIDIDSDRNSNYIIIDAPEQSEWASLDASTSGKDKTPAYDNVICIDDDDDDDGSGDCGSTHDGLKGGNQHSHFTTINKSQPPCDQPREFFSQSSKCWDTFSRKISSINHQNFSSNASRENDDLDCYIEEDFLGSIRQQWEEASLRKKMFGNVTKGQSSRQDEVGPARFNAYFQNNLDVGKSTEAWMPNTIRNHENDNLNTMARIGENAVGGTFKKSDGKSQHADLEGSIQQEMCKKSSVSNTQVVNESTLKRCANSHSEANFNPFRPVSNGDGANSHSVVNCDPCQPISNGDGLSDLQNNIIGDREMLKKTEAYKRAQEEEWASRQKELEIQAEEAQRMRKRIKAETQRLLETERRQKQRLEEVREAQKKDEETLNLKEQLRLEVTRELDILEANCRDMASLLRGLGIDIGGGLCPLSSEVRTAYKQALFRFHPDRASRSNIRQQIEAEEKFKLISRSKEKFMS